MSCAKLHYEAMYKQNHFANQFFISIFFECGMPVSIVYSSVVSKLDAMRIVSTMKSKE